MKIGLTQNWHTHEKLSIRRDMRSDRAHCYVIRFLKAHTHHVMPTSSCAMHALEIDCDAALLVTVLNDGSALPYGEASNSGHARYALFTVKCDTRLVHAATSSQLNRNKPNNLRNDEGATFLRLPKHRLNDLRSADGADRR